MQQLTTYIDYFLNFFNIDGSKIFLSNSISDYVFVLVIFILSIIIFSLAQFFALSWFASVSRRTETKLDDVFVKIVRSFKPPFYLFVSFWFSLRFINIYGIADSIVTAVLVIWLVYQTVIIVGILVEDIVFRYFADDSDATTKSAIKLISNVARAVIWVFGILMVLSNFGIDVTSLVAGAGIAGIAIAFALQGILADLFSSFSLYFDKPFKVGDFIKTGDSKGVVKHIGVKSTRIQSNDGEEIVLSNQELTSAKIQNYKLMEERRVSFSFGVLYETDLQKLRKIPEIVRTIVESEKQTRFDRAHFKSFGDSSLDFEVVYFVLGQDYSMYMDIQQSINFKLFEYFEENGIGFAYPTRTIHMNNID